MTETNDKLATYSQFDPQWTSDSKRTVDACLAMICGYYGTPLSIDVVTQLSGSQPDKRSEVEVLKMFEPFGFRAVPLEGSLDELPGVPRPCLVLMKGEPQRYFLLLDITPEQVVFINPLQTPGNDPKSFSTTLTLQAFGDLWAGEAIDVRVQGQETLDSLAGIKNSLGRFWKFRKRWGLIPPYKQKIQFAGVVLGFLTFTLFSGLGAPFFNDFAHPWVQIPLSLAFILALWSYFFGKSCGGCSRAKMVISDFPYAELGILVYGLLFMLSLFKEASPLVFFAVSGALGGHIHLVRLLRKHHLRCYPCFGVASCVTFLTVYYLAQFGALSAGSTVAFGLANIPLGFILIKIMMKVYDKFKADQKVSRFITVAVKELRTLHKLDPEGKQVSIVTYVKKGCGACTYFKSLIGPTIQEKFPESVFMTERTVDDPTFPTPLIIVHGTHSACLYGYGPGVLLARTTQFIEKALHARTESEPPTFSIETPDVLTPYGWEENKAA